jgi:hypothetical protein
MPPKLTHEIITAAIDGYESQKREIDSKIAQLRQMLDGNQPKAAATSEPTRRKRRKMSRAARARIAEAQRLRWAKTKGEVASRQAATPAAPKRKRRLSKEGRARIIAATKARWAKLRAEKAKQAK